MTLFVPIKCCRVCDDQRLDSILDLGSMSLTGVFPKNKDQDVGSGPLEIVRCGNCGLVQLKHNYDPGVLYGHNYGYRSGLNQSMVRHLESIVRNIESKVELNAGDLIVDIGSNDATLLKHYAKPGLDRIGVDPTGVKFHEYYPEDIALVADFFTKEAIESARGDKKAKVITSISMFYDLEQPVVFARAVSERLAEDGVWVLEQSYLPAMIENNSYDTICHEHLEYYGLKQIAYIADQAGLRILDVSFNDVNGGSFMITCCRKESRRQANQSAIDAALQKEDSIDANWREYFAQFRERIEATRAKLLDFVKGVREKGGRIVGYGASTKGNVLLQFCGLSPDEIESIAEVNEDKFGCFTPGSKIPIIPESEARQSRPDYFLVLPWHFKKSILLREKPYIESGGKFLFPLPEPESFP